MNWFKKTQSPPATPTFKAVAWNLESLLPWQFQPTPQKLDHYQDYWEARYFSRIKPTVEVVDQFSAFAAIYGRMLEYGWAARHVLPSDKVLDVGSGKSIFPAKLSTHAQQVVAVDLQDYAEAHQTLQSELGVSYVWQQGNATRLSFQDNSFSCVTCISVLEHIPTSDDMIAARELIRVCQPGGRVIISTPYSHFHEIEDPDHPDGLQRYYTFNKVLGLFSGMLLRNFNFIVFGMPEDKVRPRFGHPQEGHIIVACFVKPA